MTTAELKYNLFQVIDKINDNSTLQALYAQLVSKNETVAFHPNGEPMSRQEYKSALSKAEKQIGKGDYISVEEMETEA